jgi:hypothetical protein
MSIKFKQLSLPLLVAGIRTDYPHNAAAPHDLAVATQLLDRCPDLHNDLQTGNALATDEHRLFSVSSRSAFIGGRK